MRRSDQPEPSEREDLLLLGVVQDVAHAGDRTRFRPDVNVSIATGNGRFSAVDQWPVLGVHRGTNAESRVDGADWVVRVGR